MGIAQDERERRTTNYSGRLARRFHYRTLLGLHLRGGSLQRVSCRTSAVENLERGKIRVACRRYRSLRRTIRRNVKSTAAFRLYRRRFAHQRRAKRNSSVAASLGRGTVRTATERRGY